MRIRCLHGFFMIDEVAAGQVGRFVSIYGLKLVAWNGVFTFPLLAGVPEYSIKGASLLGATATKTFAGTPGELFKVNGLAYNFNVGRIVPIASISRKANVSQSGNIFVSNGLVIPGSLMDDGTRVKNFTAWFSVDSMTFRYSEVTSD